MHKGFLKTASILAAIAVALGAFGAHQLDGVVADKAVRTFETAVKYQFYHVLALALAGVLYQPFHNKWIRIAGICFILGIVLFSGSLYVLTFKLATVSSGLGWAGPVTPFGGLAFILGWIFLAIGIKKGKYVDTNR